MTTAHKWTAAALAVAIILAGFLTYGWVSEHIASAVLAVQQKADNEASAVLQEKETENQAALAAQLATFATMKQANQTPAQIVKAVPQLITLPAPIYQVTQAAAPPPGQAALPDAPKVGDLIVPQSDAKILYDAGVDCKANAAKLATCSSNLTDQTALVAVKDTEIKQQSVALKGGTFWQRTKTALEFAGAGAAAGAITVAVLKR